MLTLDVSAVQDRVILAAGLNAYINSDGLNRYWRTRAIKLLLALERADGSHKHLDDVLDPEWGRIVA